MAAPAAQLPSDVWIHVFQYLATADKLNVRACCKYFSQLVDRGCLWRDFTVPLRFKQHPYTARFWASLRRRRTVRVAVQGAKAKDWEQLAVSLPALSTIRVVDGSRECLEYLRKFRGLRRLFVGSESPLALTALAVAQPEQLTHLTLCGVDFPSDDVFVAVVSQFTRLSSLVYHPNGNHRYQVQTSRAVVARLPKLKHLSWHTNSRPLPEKPLGEPVPLPGPALTSLELVVRPDPLLWKDCMSSFARLESLAVFYAGSHDVRLLRTWLRDLRRLSTLVVARGPPPREYARYIPATVTRLTLCLGHFSPRDVTAVAARLPGLLHLHLDPWPSSSRGGGAGHISNLFPQLRGLKVRFGDLGERDFLGLHRCQNLKWLTLIDSESLPESRLSKLTDQLQTLSGYRISVLATSPLRRDPLVCFHQVY